MRKLAATTTVIALAAAMIGCSGSQTRQPSNTARGPAQPAAPTAADPATGKQIFQQNCVQCHGSNGEQISGWKESVRGMTLAQVEKQVHNGGGGMPAFEDQLSSSQITAVSDYAKQLAQQ